jgi:hypothetical protein
MAETLFEKDHCIPEPLMATATPKKFGKDVLLAVLMIVISN